MIYLLTFLKREFCRSPVVRLTPVHAQYTQTNNQKWAICSRRHEMTVHVSKGAYFDKRTLPTLWSDGSKRTKSLRNKIYYKCYIAYKLWGNHLLKVMLLTNQTVSVCFPGPKIVCVHGGSDENSSSGIHRPLFDICTHVSVTCSFCHGAYCYILLTYQLLFERHNTWQYEPLTVLFCSAGHRGVHSTRRSNGRLCDNISSSSQWHFDNQ